MVRQIRAQLLESAQVKQKTAETLADSIATFAEQVVQCYRDGGRLILLGNGGSAADAQHIAGELVSRFRKERRALPAIALTTNTSILTAIGNDYDYDSVFTRQIEAWVSPGDVVVGISTSGHSANVLSAMQKARELGAYTVGLTGRDGGPLAAAVDLVLVVPSHDTPRIQEAHSTIGHIVCDLVEQTLFP